ncbi:hypothetical protein MDA_GLEAN10012375 [Myotis davidii]|uniref:Uncharacterized protein n=1 Tax=Myotis davidii TaxID=225400 RepID=L5MJJ1_MYODS|nr:hypothetical protein MDA_GLEAN10012375 [Myotis davidii]
MVLGLDSGRGAWPHFLPAFPSVSRHVLNTCLLGLRCIMKRGQRSAEGTVDGSKKPPDYRVAAGWRPELSFTLSASSREPSDAGRGCRRHMGAAQDLARSLQPELWEES